MRIYNADGSEVESCGNAARCVARLLMEEKDRDRVTIDTPGGELLCADAGAGSVTVNIGAPHLEWKDIPLSEAMDTNHVLFEIDGKHFDGVGVNVGNPHCVLFLDNAETVPVAALGPKIERHELFPARINAEFVSVKDRTHLRMRVWERGAGITSACGTGACASAVAAHRRGLTDRKVEVKLDGGALTIEWRESDGHILMTGPATLSFKGDIDLGTYAS